MKQTLKIILGVVFLLAQLPQTIRAQVFVEYEVPEYFTNRVKTMDEFMKRFNHRQTVQYLDSSVSDLHIQQIMSLFCFDSVRNRYEEVVDFANAMVDSNIRLSYSMPNYYCELRCHALYKKTPTEILLYMAVEHISDGDFYRWSIVGAKGDILKATPNRISSTMHLSPVDDDRNFLDLREMLEKHPEEVSAHTHTQWYADELSVFVTLVQTGMLKVDGIEDMQYVFNVGGYTFRVMCVDRKTNNNGWLIYDFFKHQ